MNKYVVKASEIVGSKAQLAKALGVNPQTFYTWSLDRVPAERVLGIEKATLGAISRHEMRPDIYPVEAA
jgi:DNA-binding transcriptional regulator YdaS (Cro superfamily)